MQPRAASERMAPPRSRVVVVIARTDEGCGVVRNYEGAERGGGQQWPGCVWSGASGHPVGGVERGERTASPRSAQRRRGGAPERECWFGGVWGGDGVRTVGCPGRRAVRAQRLPAGATLFDRAGPWLLARVHDCGAVRDDTVWAGWSVMDIDPAFVVGGPDRGRIISWGAGACMRPYGLLWVRWSGPPSPQYICADEKIMNIAILDQRARIKRSAAAGKTCAATTKNVVCAAERCLSVSGLRRARGRTEVRTRSPAALPAITGDSKTRRPHVSTNTTRTKIYTRAPPPAHRRTCWP